MEIICDNSPTVPIILIQHLGVSENVVYPIVPNGFADHYPVSKNG